MPNHSPRVGGFCFGIRIKVEANCSVCMYAGLVISSLPCGALMICSKRPLITPGRRYHPRQGRPFSSSWIQNFDQQIVDAPVKRHYPTYRRLLLVKRSRRSSLVARKNLRAHFNSWAVRSSLLGRPWTGQARAIFRSKPTALGAVRGSSCLQVHLGSSLMRGIVRNVDESRGAELAGSADLNTSP